MDFFIIKQCNLFIELEKKILYFYKMKENVKINLKYFCCKNLNRFDYNKNLINYYKLIKSIYYIRLDLFRTIFTVSVTPFL